MARYKFVDMSPRFLPVVLEDQLVPGSFAHAAHHLVDALDLSGFDSHDRNDLTGATAHAPSMLLKAVLLAYSRHLRTPMNWTIVGTHEPFQCPVHGHSRFRHHAGPHFANLLFAPHSDATPITSPGLFRHSGSRTGYLPNLGKQ